METHTYPHLPAAESTVHLALYANVSNAAGLRKRLVTAATLPGEDGQREREAVNFAFVDAKLITSRLHIQTAVYQAILAHIQGSLRTKGTHSEVLWALSPGHNISEAIKRFGISDSTQSLLVVRIGPPSFMPRDFETSTGAVVKGNPVPLSILPQLTDWALVRKYYKLNADPVVTAFPHGDTAQCAVINQLVISCIAMKSVSA